MARATNHLSATCDVYHTGVIVCARQHTKTRHYSFLQWRAGTVCAIDCLHFADNLIQEQRLLIRIGASDFFALQVKALFVQNHVVAQFFQLES